MSEYSRYLDEQLAYHDRFANRILREVLESKKELGEAEQVTQTDNGKTTSLLATPQSEVSQAGT